MNFLVCSRGSQSEKLRKRKKKKVLRPCQRIEKAAEYEGDSDTNCHWCSRNGPSSLEKGLEKLDIGERIETIQTTPLLE